MTAKFTLIKNILKMTNNDINCSELERLIFEHFSIKDRLVLITSFN